MTIHNHNNGKKIILSKALDNRSKWLNVFYFITFSMALPLMIKMVGMNDGGQAFEILLTTGFIIAYAIAAYRFINKALQSEILYINPTTLMITKSGFLNSKSQHYDRNRVTNFRHLDKPETTKHPLAGESFDYLGFQTTQELINEMHGDHRLAFDYDGKRITFGENIYSWDFEELQRLLNEIAVMKD